MRITFFCRPDQIEQARYQLGQVPEWLQSASEDSAREIINECYAFGGWRPMKSGPKLGPNNEMIYPGDPPQKPFAMIEFRQERVFAYSYEFWGIVQPDGSAEFARLD